MRITKLYLFLLLQDLSRRDDLWSWYFVVLDFFNEELEWRISKNNKMDDVKLIKARCMADPESYLWKSTTRDLSEIKQIFYSISKLHYADRPDYDFIRNQLYSLLQKEDSLETNTPNSVPFIFNHRIKESLLQLSLLIQVVIVNLM